VCESEAEEIEKVNGFGEVRINNWLFPPHGTVKGRACHGIAEKKTNHVLKLGWLFMTEIHTIYGFMLH
jgi:hypothetical protein